MRRPTPALAEKNSATTAPSRAPVRLPIPVKATVKKSRKKKVHFVDKTLERSNLWEIQTPQVFEKELILKAYRRFRGRHFTDDSALVERLGFRVRLLRGSEYNIKITSPEDLRIAEAILKR